MVVFTCNHCNDTLQKPRVPKHISFECKKTKHLGVSLCCIDCLVNFNSDTFASHTKCVSEEERYSGGKFVPKASSNKGERKQNSWINTVRSVLSQPSLTKQQKQLLEAISYFENVPRKKAKFQNFIRSSVRTIRVFPDVVDSVFELLDKEFKDSVTVNDDAGKAGTKKENQGDVNNVENSEEVVNGQDCNGESKAVVDEKSEIQDKECNSMRKKEKGNIILMSENEKNVSIKDEEKLEKKKKKKRKLEMHTEEDTLCDIENNLIKKKKHREIENVRELENGTESLSPRLKNGKEEEKGVNLDTNHVDEVFEKNEVSKKKKKRKREEIATTNDGEKGSSNNKEIENVRELENGTESVSSRLKNGEEEGKRDGFDINNIDEAPEKNEVSKKKKKRKREGIATTDENEKNSVNNKEIEKKLKTGFDGSAKGDSAHCDTNGTETQKKENSLDSEDAKTKLVSVVNNENEVDACIKFDWEEVATSILLTVPNHDLSLKKMKKKIAKKYLVFHQNDKSFEEIVKRFEKKVKKMSNIDINENRIRLRQ